MKKILFFTAILISFAVKSQIKITQENSTSESVKPELDNTKDISEYRNASQFLGLIGHKIFGLPLNPNYDYKFTSFSIMYQTPEKYRKENGSVYKAGEFRPINKKDYEDLISEKYFIVENIDFIVGKKVTPEEWNKEMRFSTYQGGVKLYIKQVDTNRVFILENRVNSLDFFLSVDYYEFLKSKIGNEILVEEYERFKIVDKINNLTPEPSVYNSKHIYKIVDLIIEKSESNYSSKPDLKFKIENSDGKTRNICVKSDDYSSLSKFVYKEQYDKYLEKFKLLKDEKSKVFNEKMEKERAESELKMQQELKNLVNKYGEVIAEKIYYHKLEPGMTLSMMFDSMNKIYIDYVSHTESKDLSGTWDIYTYKRVSGDYYIITLLNGKIVRFSKSN